MPPTNELRIKNTDDAYIRADSAICIADSCNLAVSVVFKLNGWSASFLQYTCIYTENERRPIFGWSASIFIASLKNIQILC